MDQLAAIADARAAAAELAESDNAAARRFGEALRFYLENAARGAELEPSLGLMPGEPWWSVEAREKRDAALRQLRQRFYADRRVAQAAYSIERESLRYASSSWRFDQGREDMPAYYADTATEWLWRAFTSGAVMPLGKRQLQNILAAECNDPPVANASNAPDDGKTTLGDDPHGFTRPAGKARRTG